MICTDCRHYTPDSEGYGGIGVCGRNVSRETSAIVYHKGTVELHRQQALPYPGQQACSEYDAKLT